MPDIRTGQELLDYLRVLPPEVLAGPVLLAKDAEGNDYSQLSSVGTTQGRFDVPGVTLWPVR